MSSIAATLRSPRFQRTLPWLAALIFAAGVIAFLVAYLGNTGTSRETPLTNKPAQGYKSPQTVPLSPEVRRVAGLFVKTAVARKNLAQSWPLVAPAMKAGMTKRQWLSGNIPVVPFPDIGQVRLKVDYSYPKYALLELAILPKSNKIKGQVFFAEFKKFGQKWLVTSWAPRGYFVKPANLND